MNMKSLLITNQSRLFSLALFAAFATSAADIDRVVYGKSADGAYEVQILGDDFKNVTSYSLNNPSRIVVDIPNAKSRLVEKITTINNPIIANVAVIEGSDRVRATINMTKSVPYKLIDSDNKITVVVKDAKKGRLASQKRTKKKMAKKALAIADTRFQRGSGGQAKLLIKLPNDNASVDIERIGSKVVAKLHGAKFRQAKKLNVIDFGTSVKSVDIYRNSLSINTVNDDFEVVSYQNDNIYSIELNKSTIVKQDQNLLPPGDSRREYNGDSLSLNFQDIEVRSVLQLIGDFTNTNIVVSDEVNGSITLRLNDVPWDQALDIILQTKGLAMQKNGNVISIAPSEVVAKQIAAINEISSVKEKSAPLQQQLIQLQYTRAEHIMKILDEDSKANAKKDDDTGYSSLLSARGSVSADARTNTLIINDVPTSIDKVRRLVASLDVAVRQVLIDARIVSASNDFTHELGVKWGGLVEGLNHSGRGALAAGNTNGTTELFNGEKIPVNNRLGVNLGVSNPAGTLGLMLLSNDFLLDMELSALQDDGRGEVISSPRVITQDGGQATIKSGKEIAYTTRDNSGTAKVNFKPVVLKLDVTPKIAPNNMVDMILKINKDTVGALTQTLDGVIPSIDTNAVSTQVLVDNGETVVLGGVYEQAKNKSVAKVPVLGDIPVIGRAFRRDTNSITKSELLIFVTPKIIDKRFVSRDKFSELRN